MDGISRGSFNCKLPDVEFEEALLRAADGSRVNSRKKERIVTVVTENQQKRD